MFERTDLVTISNLADIKKLRIWIKFLDFLIIENRGGDRKGEKVHMNEWN